jgi:hypothetical protein
MVEFVQIIEPGVIHIPFFDTYTTKNHELDKVRVSRDTVHSYIRLQNIRMQNHYLWLLNNGDMDMWAVFTKHVITYNCIIRFSIDERNEFYL